MTTSRHNPRCGICGAPTRPREIVAGVQGWVCVSCGGATLEQRAVEQLTGVMPQGAQPAPLSASVPSRQPTAPIAHLPTAPPRRPPPPPAAPLAADNISDSRFEAELLAMQIRRERRLTMLLGLVTVVVVVVLAIPLSFVVYQSVKSTTTPVVAAPAPTLPREPAPVPVAPPTDPPPETPEPPVEDLGATAAAPQPAPEAPPIPAPPDAGGPSTTSELVDRGWAVVDRSPATAARFFIDALDREPGHADASYGLGYAYLSQSRPEAAAQHLCNALRVGDTEIRRDVQSLLRTNQLECSP